MQVYNITREIKVLKTFNIINISAETSFNVDKYIGKKAWMTSQFSKNTKLTVWLLYNASLLSL